MLISRYSYQFDPDIRGRFNPEIDHIFPRKLKDRPNGYQKAVDIIWNMQPTKGDINGYKLNHHPKLIFTDCARAFGPQLESPATNKSLAFDNRLLASSAEHATALLHHAAYVFLI